jgi:type I restriction enzyme S subunit
MTDFATKRLKFVSSEPLKYGANSAAEYDNREWPRFVRITDVTEGGQLREETFRSLPPEIAEGYYLKDGDILLARSGATVGKSFIYSPAWGKACYAGYLIRLRTAQTHIARYVFWCLQSNEYWAAIDANLIQATIQNFSAERYASLQIPSPPVETQRRIAQFLDEKTSCIDGLITKKRALLDRLAEKRQALITRAVTKGLNPAVPMKDSDIDWLGNIPAHWDVIPFKRRCTIQSGQVDPTDPNFASMPLVAPDHIEARTGRLLEVRSAEEQGAISGKYFCPEGAVLYSKIRPALRKVALFPGQCLCSADMYAIDPGADIDRHFLYFFLLTDAFSSYAELESLRVAMPKVNREALGTFPIPVPPMEEQCSIAEYCLAEDLKHLACIDQVTRSIQELEEYRAALITDAVTGKLGELR